MARSTLGQSLDPALTAWRNLVSEGPEGPGIDLTETNRTRLCQARLELFLENPSAETFRGLWGPETLAGYWMPNAGMLLGPDGAVDALHTLLTEISAATEFDSAWTGRLGGTTNWGLYELYGRLQGGDEPIPSVEAKEVLQALGYEVEDDPTSVSTAIEDFEAEYVSRVGHVTAGEQYEVPIYAEIDEFFRLVQNVDRETINAQLTGPYAPLFRPLIGHRIHTETSDSFHWHDVDDLVEAHVEARTSGDYDDMETKDWGGQHIESWKWQFEDYFQDVVREEFTLTDLDADDIPRLFERIENPTEEFDQVTNVPAQMMGAQFHRLTWRDIVDYCHEHPEESATVLSDLFDEDLLVVDRLNEFHEFFSHLTTREENNRSPGSLLRAATALLMYAYPRRHITFQYERLDDFFGEYSTSDGLETGFDARQYKEVAMACRELLERVDDHIDDASMIDVQTLIYIAHNA